MISVDTNVLARLFLKDDLEQTSIAQKFFMARTVGDPAFVSAVVIAEFIWLLTSRYRFSMDAVHAVLMIVFASGNIVVERSELLSEAIAAARESGADVADAIIGAVAQAAGASHTVTFDRDAARRVAGMELLK